jgi:hypothetical protein
MADDDNNSIHHYEEGKRAGAHPLVVVFAIIFGVWILINLYVPSGKDRVNTPPEQPSMSSSPTEEEPDGAPVMFKVASTMLDINTVSVVVSREATASQISSLLKSFRAHRLANTLTELLPPTTPGHKLGDHAIADIFVFSDAKFATPDAVHVLARGAHAPGHLYPQAIPFEIVMEEVRGHYRIDLSDPGKPDQASIGFADESGIHSKDFSQIF